MTVPLVRTSERNDFKRCPWYWQKHWLEGWSTRREPTWAWFGTAMHVALAYRYAIGTERRKLSEVLEVFEDALDGETRRMYTEGLEWYEEDVVDAKELGIAMLRGYVTEYGTDQTWDVIHTEQPFQIDVVTADDELIAVYCGTWDLLVWDVKRKRFRLVDHKTARQFVDFSWLALNDQGGSYLWVAPEVLLHKGIWTRQHDIDGITFNYLKKSMPDERPKDAQGRALNKNGTVSQRQPAPRFHREETFRSPEARVEQHHKVIREIKHMNLIRSGELEAYKNPTPDCVRCPLFDVCDLHDQGDDWEDMLEQTFKKRDPYADHRAAMEQGGVEIHGTT